MSYSSELSSASRTPQDIVWLILDKCSLTHGTSPCTASETGDNKCYNTRSTCNDPDNYTNINEEELLINGDFADWTDDNPDSWTIVGTDHASNYVTELGAEANDSETVVLLHMDGTDGSPTFTDSGAGASHGGWTRSGNAQIDTADYVFGSASGLFDGTGDYLYAADHDNFNFNSDEWTIDFRIKMTSLGNYGIYSQHTNSSNYFKIETTSGGAISLTVCTSGSAQTMFAGSLYADTWHHVAVVANGSKYRVFVDGTRVINTNLNTSATDLSGNVLIGSSYDISGAIGRSLNGWLDEFRVSKVARWTESFNKPTSAYGASGGAKIVSDGTEIGIKQYTTEIGAQYKFTLKVESVVSGSVDISLVGSGHTIGNLSTLGTHTLHFTSDIADMLQITNGGSSACEVVISSASLKKLNVFRFCGQGAKHPLPSEPIRPYMVKEPKYLPTELDYKRALTVNAKVTLSFADELDKDTGIDPYVTDRSLYPDILGTFWRKLLARNPYYIGRTLLIKKGFSGLREDEYQTTKFIVDQIDIDKNGVVNIVCKDLLKRADRVQIPVATSGKVTDNPLTSDATTINCDDTSDYDSAGYLRIDDEVIKYTGKTSTSFTGCTRGQYSTTAEEHDEDEKIQMCYHISNTNVVNIILDILQNKVGLNDEDINFSDFFNQQELWLPSFVFTGIITKPMKASEVLAELQEQSMSYIWWSEEDQKVKFKVIAPEVYTNDILTDDENIISISIDNAEETRISRAEIYYNMDVVTGDLKKPENYANIFINYDIDAESADQYGEKAVRTIYSRWIPSGSSILVDALASRYRRAFRNSAKKVTATVELKDYGWKTGDFPRLQTSMIQGVDGSELVRTYTITEKKQKKANQFEFTLIDTSWDREYGFIAPPGQSNWDAATASEKLYAYISDGNEKLGTNNDPGFYIF